MDRSTLWARVSPFARLRQAKALQGIHTARQFLAILERERVRSDRNGHQFSMIIFETGNPDQDSPQIQRLAQTLVKRMRSSDEAGWFDGHRIAVVLPDTSADGAWKLADDVCQVMAGKASPPECTVYTYPSKWYPNGKGHLAQLHFADLSPEWKTIMSRRFSMSTKHANGLSTDFATQQSPANATPNCRSSARSLEPLFLRPLPFGKRAVDIVGATVALIVFSPIMVAVAIAIKLTSIDPVTFKQQRAGLGGRPFMFYKFRSMVIDAEARKKDLLKYNKRTGPAFKMTNDPRVTRVGDFIRKWSLDELPQLFNVLRGDMSLVGPRPPILDEVLHYETWQYRRLAITPGITCIWQVYARHDKSFDRWTRLDIEYILKRSPLLDAKILLKTLPAVLSRRGAC